MESSSRFSALVCVALIGLVAIVFAQTVNHEFVNYDDYAYVTQNEWVTSGLSFDSVLWGFAHTYESNWHPLTWISHIIDWQLYGSWAGGHHLTSVVLHALTAIVLYFALAKLTGEARPSAAVAILWAVHPLRVESVAWVAERKDVLCGLFFTLSLLAYARYAERPTRGRYLAVGTTLALGLLAKPMIVTLPCVLLLLDAWPLGRLRSRAEAWPLLREKLPLFALVVLSCVVTFLAQSVGGSVEPLAERPLDVRVANSLVAYGQYLGSTIVPVGLAPFYPHPQDGLPAWKWLVSAALVLAVTVGTLFARQRCPYLLVGWLWYLGMLVPVIGLVQVGLQSHADRYTYLPQIGLLIAVVWGVQALTTTCQFPWATIALSVAFVVFIVLSWQQVRRWRTTETLLLHTLSCTTNNRVAHVNLGYYYWGQSRTDEAIAQLQEGFRVANGADKERTDLVIAYIKMGDLYFKHDLPEQAIVEYRRAEPIGNFGDQIRIQQGLVNAFTLQGTQFAAAGKLDEAIVAFREAFVRSPNERPIRRKLATAYLASGEVKLRAGKVADAIAAFRAAVDVDATLPESQKRLDEALRASQP